MPGPAGTPPRCRRARPRIPAGLRSGAGPGAGPAEGCPARPAGFLPEPLAGGARRDFPAPPPELRAGRSRAPPLLPERRVLPAGGAAGAARPLPPPRPGGSRCPACGRPRSPRPGSLRGGRAEPPGPFPSLRLPAGEPGALLPQGLPATGTAPAAPSPRGDRRVPRGLRGGGGWIGAALGTRASGWQRPPRRHPGEPSPALRLSRIFPPRTRPRGGLGGPWARGGPGQFSTLAPACWELFPSAQGPCGPQAGISRCCASFLGLTRGL